VVGADTVVLVVEGLGNRSVGQDAQARLVMTALVLHCSSTRWPGL
jgi:hypothetical protein